LTGGIRFGTVGSEKQAAKAWQAAAIKQEIEMKDTAELRSDDGLDTLENLERLVKSMTQRLDQLVDIQLFQLLGEEKTVDFEFQDRPVRLHIPDAAHDAIQRKIMKSRTFFESNLLRAAQPHIRPGATILDVGANIGNHTVFFGLCCEAASVAAIEPQAHCHRILERNVALNGLSQVRTFNALAGRAEGFGEFRSAFANNLGATSFEESETGRIPVITLDGLDVGKVDFMKIDVEGMQMSVLEGATRILETDRPTIWMELRVNRGEYEEPAALLESLGYRPNPISRNDFIFTPT
jgi:FkbM family methyltransferase